MSRPAAAAAAAPVEVAAPAGKGKKKLIHIVAIALVLVAGAAAAAVVVMKQRAAAAAAAEADGDDTEDTAHDAHPAKRDPKAVPTFVALDPFTVNLADREAERYAQVGITLELADAAASDRIKAYMPAIRNNILMVLAHKTSQQLVERAGKEELAAEVLRESLRPLGYEPPQPAAEGKKKKKAASHDAEPPPVVRVHFSNFIIQ
jgi:flagellar FliL protein